MHRQKKVRSTIANIKKVFVSLRRFKSKASKVV
jgi:hypothetical protein